MTPPAPRATLIEIADPTPVAVDAPAARAVLDDDDVDPVPDATAAPLPTALLIEGALPVPIAVTTEELEPIACDCDRL